MSNWLFAYRSRLGPKDTECEGGYMCEGDTVFEARVLCARENTVCDGGYSVWGMGTVCEGGAVCDGGTVCDVE